MPEFYDAFDVEPGDGMWLPPSSASGSGDD
jgi:predicted metalloendopeptidase